MDVVEVTAEGRVVGLESLKRAVPLGRDCFATGRIETRTINLAIEVLRGYQEILRLHNVRLLRAVATSAVAEAANQELFVERLFMATGLAVDIITGAEEVRLLYAGVRDAFERAGAHGYEDALIVEQGAGHIDLSLFQAGEVVAASSLPWGTLRLAAGAATDHVTGSAAFKVIKEQIGGTLDGISNNLPLAKVEALVLLGSEARFAAAQIDPSCGGPVHSVLRAPFLRFAHRLTRLRPEQLAERYALPFDECESLAPCLATYAEFVERTHVKSLFIPWVSLRNGLVLELLAEVRGQPVTHLDAQTYASAESVGRHYHFDEAHARHVADLACDLFDRLRKEHRLERRERRLLRVAALLHDIGCFVSGNSHHKHSEYLIGAAEIFGVKTRDKAIVASVARYHRRAHPSLAHPDFATLSREDRATVSKLAALLRLADALDRSHAQRISIASVKLLSDELQLVLDGADDLAQERHALNAKGGLFEDVFGRRVSLQTRRLET